MSSCKLTHVVSTAIVAPEGQRFIPSPMPQVSLAPMQVILAGHWSTGHHRFRLLDEKMNVGYVMLCHCPVSISWDTPRGHVFIIFLWFYMSKTLFWTDSGMMFFCFLGVRVFMSKPYFGRNVCFSVKPCQNLILVLFQAYFLNISNPLFRPS